MRSSIVKWQGRMRPLLALGLAGSIAFAATACLKSKDDDDAPQGEEATAGPALKRASIRVKLPEGAGLDLREEAERVRVNVVRSVDGKKTETVSEPLVFPLAADETYVLSDVSAGDVFILVDLLGSDDNPIASGELRTVLNADTVPEVQVRLEPLPLELGLTLSPAASSETPGAPAPTTEPAAVKAALKGGNCLGCHSTRAKLGGLVLDTFPYTSTRPELAAGGSAAIMNEIVMRVTSTESPMPPPPAPLLKPDAVSVLEDFRDALAAPPADPVGNPAARSVQLVKMTIYLDEGKSFDTELASQGGNRYAPKAKVDVLPGKTYSYDLQVYGQDATLLGEVKKGTFEVPLSGEVELSLSFDASGNGLNQPALDIAPPSSY